MIVSFLPFSLSIMGLKFCCLVQILLRWLDGNWFIDSYLHKSPQQPPKLFPSGWRFCCCLQNSLWLVRFLEYSHKHAAAVGFELLKNRFKERGWSWVGARLHQIIWEWNRGFPHLWQVLFRILQKLLDFSLFPGCLFSSCFWNLLTMNCADANQLVPALSFTWETKAVNEQEQQLLLSSV